MDALARLQKNLSNINRIAVSRVRPGDSLQMYNERMKLQEWVKGTWQSETMPLATIESALRAYRQYKSINGLRQIRLVCYGCTQSCDAYRVIEDPDAFNKLLEYVDYYRNRRRSFRKLFRALLASYFSYDPDAPEASGRNNWEKLRQFLSDYLASLVVNEFTPDWLVVLAKYPDLLSTDPGRALDITPGDWSIFNEICERLELDDGSWLVRQLVMAPITAVWQMDDAAFREHLDGLLLLLNERPLFAGAGLAILLDRYARCADRRIHASLRDFAVGLWGNPWLADNAHQWKCGETARAMLAHWLKRQLLSEFFGVLSNDDKKHARRLNFWDLYSEDMTGMYFALGRDAYVSGSMSFFQFRIHAKGLVAKLAEEKYGIHTCIMQFAHHHVVEFNHENNVAYFYDTRQGTPSFYFAKGWVEIGAISVQDITEGVDIARVSKPIRHQDSKKLAWEGQFAQELGATENAIRAFCGKYRCAREKLPNGAQWVRPGNHQQFGIEVWSVLEGWGFNYSVEENAYFLAAD